MRTLFLTVPQWYPMNPYLAPAVLVGELKSKGYEAHCYDLNIEFFNDILTRESVLESGEAAKRMLPRLLKTVNACPEPEKNFLSFSKKERTELLRYKAISEFFDNEPELLAETADNINQAVSVLKSRDKFYNPELLFRAKDTLSDALRIISLPFEPAKILIDNYIANPVLSLSYADVKAQCFDDSINMFIGYYEKKFAEIPLDGFELIGISVTDLSQLVPALTLGRMIKEKTGKTVCMGGNYIFKIIEDIKKQPEFFKVFCDFISVGDGETAAVDVARYMSGEISIGEVRSLVWLDGDTVVTNETAPLLDMDSLAYPDFDDFDFSKYFSPDIVLPVQLGKGCYWGKCTFCDFYTGQQKYDIKSVSHAADEVEYLVKKYNVSHFIFVDEAVTPAFYDKFANEISRRGLKIYFYSFARFDKGFTREVLKNLYENGAMFFSWGFEAASQRLLDLMNKGVDSDIRLRILNDSRDIGMWNQCTFLLGYPTETADELQQTIDIIEDTSLINSCTPSNFVLKKNAILKDEVEEVGLTNITSNGDFHISMSYDSKNTKMSRVKRNRMEFQNRFLLSTADRLWSLGFTDTDHLLLYLSRYSRDWVRDYRLNYNKKQY